VAAPFATPADLAGFVSGCDLVIAHRMHACIAAHSFAVPTIGLTWDEKLASFFALAGRSRYAVDGPALAPAAMVELALAALAEGVDRAALATLIDRTRADVAALGADILRAARRSPAVTPAPMASHAPAAQAVAPLAASPVNA
jgi:polysaccharide pyruvyl transferase WcaK-like protein